MDKENKVYHNEFKGLTAIEIWEKLFNKELNTKKSILEYIELTKVLKKGNIDEDQITETYNYIYDCIEGLRDSIKPNTMMYLKNTLKSQLGKYVKEKDPIPVNYFLEFFKESVPENKRRKDFTRVLNDLNSITDDQLWTTLTYINRGLINNEIKLNSDHIKDIVDIIKKVVSKNNIKLINKIKSLKLLTDKLNISIISDGEGFKVKNI